MVDFRSSGGSLGIYSKTSSLRSPASSSLDKPAGTLSQVDSQAAGQAARQVIQAAQIPSDASVASKSYSLAETLLRADTGIAVAQNLAPASQELLSKFAEQATPEQKASLRGAAAQTFTPAQMAELNEIIPASSTSQIPWGTLALIGVGILALGGIMRK